MKRFAALMICLVLCCSLFASCADASEPARIRFQGLKEYEAMLADLRLPTDFIQASQFHMLGFLHYGSITNDGYYICRYRFSSGVDLNIYHDTEQLVNNSFFGSDYLAELPEATLNMLKIPTSSFSDFCFYRNGLYYIYGPRGHLKSIAWLAGDIHFELVLNTPVGQQLSQYEDFPILVQLLSASEEVADNAFQELCAEIGITPDLRHYRSRFETINRIVSAVFIGGTVAIIAVSWIIAKKRRARKIVTHRPQSTNTGELPLSAFTNHEPHFDTPNSH